MYKFLLLLIISTSLMLSQVDTLSKPPISTKRFQILKGNLTPRLGEMIRDSSAFGIKMKDSSNLVWRLFPYFVSPLQRIGDSIKLNITNLADTVKYLESLDSNILGIAYTNRLLQQKMGYSTLDSIVCDTIIYSTTTSNVILPRESNGTIDTDSSTITGRRTIISFISITTDSMTMGYELFNGGTRIMRSERLTGNAQLTMNFVGKPLVLYPGNCLRGRIWLPSTITDNAITSIRRKVYITIKYKVQ